MLLTYWTVSRTIHHEAHVRDACVDVGVELVNVADRQIPAGHRHHLHPADCAHLALDVLIEPRLLESLGRDQQPVHVVFVTVGTEQLHDLLEPLHLLRGGRTFREFRALEVPLQHDVTESSSGANCF
jgi:hypothetical protein